MENLYFIPNNILTKNFKELKKYKIKKKRLSIIFKLYIQELYYTSYCISFKCIYAYAWGYKLGYINR